VHFDSLAKPYNEPNRPSHIDDTALDVLAQRMVYLAQQTLTGNGFTHPTFHVSGTYISDEALHLLAERMEQWKREIQVIPISMPDGEMAKGSHVYKTV
jgi:hypothetical protein